MCPQQGCPSDDLRIKLRQERRIELVGQGSRFDDLKRWKIAVERLNMTAEEAIIERSFEERNYHWPIPSNAMDANPALVQNPDY